MASVKNAFFEKLSSIFLEIRNFKAEKPCPHCVLEEFNVDKIENLMYNINTKIMKERRSHYS